MANFTSLFTEKRSPLKKNREHLNFAKRLSSQFPIPNSPFPKIVKLLVFFKIAAYPKSILFVSSALIFLSGGGGVVTRRAIAQEHPDCFMRDKSGNAIDLTRSVCGLFPEEAALPEGSQAAAGAYIIPIKDRRGNLPIVDVTFNGTKTYEMILDTGASGTLITQEMAEGLNVIPTGTGISQVADGREVEIGIGLIGSMSAGGLTISQVSVGIAPPAMSIGLLGQDFFGGYDMTIKEDVVELRARGS